MSGKARPGTGLRDKRIPPSETIADIITASRGKRKPIRSAKAAMGSDARTGCRTTPLPMENNPRVVFEQMFGDSGSTDPAVRRARMQRDRSILDSVTGTVADLKREVGHADRLEVDESSRACGTSNAASSAPSSARTTTCRSWRSPRASPPRSPSTSR